MRRLALVLIIIVLGYAGRAEADSTWYGYQILAADSTMAIGFITLSTKVWLAYLIAPPVIHSLHGNHGRIIASLGLRLASLGLGMVVMNAIHPRNTPPCPPGAGGELCESTSANGIIEGLVFGALLGCVLDAGLLAWDSPFFERKTQPKPEPSQRGLVLTSVGISPLAHGAALSLGAHF
jgi:hypothetical protein